MVLYFENNEAALFILAIILVVFLQSAIDKITAWQGNLDWLKGHFGSTIFKNQVPLLLGTLTILELLTGLMAIVAIISLLFFNTSNFAYYTAILANVSLLCLLFGQRLAKDYEGAKTIVIYFIPCLLLFYFIT